MALSIVALLLVSIVLMLSNCMRAQSLKNESYSYLTQAHNKPCDGPPYLYVTFHDKYSNIFKYSRNGCLLQTNVLSGGPLATKGINKYTELRSMMIGKYKGEDALYIADASNRASSVLLYGGCVGNTGKRNFIQTVANPHKSTGVSHTYGLCTDAEGNIYASFQHTDCILRFEKDSFELLPLPSSIRYDTFWRFHAGTFYQFGEPLGQKIDQGVRSIALVKDDIWVANEDIGGVAVISVATGMLNTIIIIPSPIGLHYDKHIDRVFVSSKQKHWQGAVYGIDPHKRRVVSKYTTDRMNHPTGITSHEDTLFVAEQEKGVIYKFSIESEKYLGHVVKHLPQEIEQIILSEC